MKKILLWVLILLLLLGTGVMLFGVILPVYFGSRDISLSGPMSMEQQADGGWLLSWPGDKRADRYQVELLADGQVLYREFVEGGNALVLPALPEDVPLTLQVTPASRFRTLFGEDHHYSKTVLKAEAVFGEIPAPEQEILINGDDKTLTMELPENTRWQYRLLDHDGNVLDQQSPEEAVRVLQFGDGSDLPIPKAGESYSLYTRICQEKPGLILYGKSSDAVLITEESLQFRKLDPELTFPSKNTVQITWGETRGTGYTVQALDPESGSWTTLSRVEQGETRSFRELIAPGQTKQYRVTAVDAQGETLMESQALTATGRERVQYATVWPVKDLPAYSASSYGEIIGTAKTGQAYCVLEEVNGMFAIRLDDRIAYIGSGYCMINLPDYLGDLCSYNITNSVYSIYAIHEFAIRNVTGEVTTGYEDVCQEDGSYLVPLLYPAAKRLLTAAQNAWDQGYRLKIYDSFRPHTATLAIYELTSRIMEDPVPDATYTGVPSTEMELPDPRPGWDYVSLGWLMTGFNYEQNSFLARDGSAHNLGIALDLTLEKRDTGEEIRMQTSMHDLSQYSVLGENNEEADLLGDIMHGAGFGGLVSEWWHFQDDHAKRDLALPYVSAGVSAQGWVRDDIGWKYRDPKGRFYSGETLEISGTQYTFDSNGYVIE